MAPAPLLEDLPGVRGCVVTDDSGTVLGQSGALAEVEIVAAQVALLAREVRQLGEALNLGSPELLTIHGPQATRCVAFQGAALAAVELEGRRSTADVEARLRDRDWSTRFAVPPPPPARETVASAERAAVFSGNLQLFAVPDLLEFMRASQRTGLLTCHTDAGIGTVQLARGKIVGAASPSSASLATQLLRAGRLTHEQLPHDAPDGAVARWVLENGLVAAEDLRAALVSRIREALVELVTWDDGRFTFDSSGGDTGVPGLDLAVDPQSLLLDIFSQLDELDRNR